MAQGRRTVFDRLQTMTRLWGWEGPLRCCEDRIDPGAIGLHPYLKVVTSYEVGIAVGGRCDCFLQINPLPQGQITTYEGAVFAIRYRIFTDWHKFRLFGRPSLLNREAARLADWLAWELFASVEKRRAFRLAHPECRGYSWRALRER
jgi:hypothetical protein